MSTTQELRKPTFVKIRDLEKVRSGYNVYVKIISTEPKEIETRDGQKIKMVDAVVGDETGISKAFFKGENATHIEKGNVIAIRNGLKKFIKNFISLELDIFGRVTKESVEINVDQSYNISEQEHKLPERGPRGPRNFQQGRRPNNRPRRNDDRPRNTEDRPRRINEDRPRRYNEDRPPRRTQGEDRPPRRTQGEDRPPRRTQGEDRPQRRTQGEDRPQRRTQGEDRPQRRTQGEDRPQRNERRQDRPQRNERRQDRPQRNERRQDRNERPQRRENNNRTYDRDFDRRRENNDNRPPRREQQRYEPRREEFRERAPIQWTKIDEISPADDRINLIVKVIAEELVQGRNKNMLRCTLGDDTGLVRAFLQDTPALRVGKSVVLFDCEARVVKEHIEVQCRGRVEAARKDVERVNEKFNLSEKSWVPVNQ